MAKRSGKRVKRLKALYLLARTVVALLQALWLAEGLGKLISRH